MENWKIFENNACNALKEKFRDLPIDFKTTGGSNAFESDIKVLKDEKPLFSIEAKLSPSQSGQFVLIGNNDVYELSTKTRYETNEFVETIIKHINENKESYILDNQKGTNINLDQAILFSWVKEHYRRKHSHFIITSHQTDGPKAVIPLDEIDKKFTITACLRRKKSGSSNVTKKHMPQALASLQTHMNRLGLAFADNGPTYIPGKKKHVVFFNKRITSSSDLSFGGNLYLSPLDEGYVLKKKSSTNNPNVIFSLNYIGNTRDLEEGYQKLRSFIEGHLKGLR
jgi:hypothetical protein